MRKSVGLDNVRSPKQSVYHWGLMDIFRPARDERSQGRAVLPLVAVVLLLSAGSWAPGLATQYEYDERVDLSLDGSATVYVSGSIPALVALHGLNLDLDPLARLDRTRIRQLYTAPGVTVRQITSSRRNARRFVHITLAVDDVRGLQEVAPLSWSRYQFDRAGDEYVLVQTVHGSTARDVPGVTWTGRELVAFRLHVPSRVLFHNAPEHNLRRGNIVLWEQPLADRLAGAPARFEVRMETQSILSRTVLIFVLTFVAAVATLAIMVWLAARQGRKVAAVTGGSRSA